MNLELLILFFLALGLDIKTFTITDILVRFIRFLPLLIEHGHLLELGSPNTGKSYISKRFNKIFELVKALSVAQLFGSLNKNMDGYICEKNKAILIDEISNLSQSDIDSNLRSSFKTYLNGDNFSRGNEILKQTTSCYFVGNSCDSLQKLLDRDPLSYSNNTFYSNIPIFFREEAMIERLIWNPGWLLTKTSSFNLTEKENEDAYEEIKNFITTNRTSENNKIQVPFTSNVRLVKKAQKIITFFITSLYKKKFSNENINELLEFTEFLLDIENGKYHHFWNTDYGKKFLVNFVPLYLPPNSTIKKIYFYSNRILVQTKENPSKYYKIAINKYGVKENETEYNNYINNQIIKPYISPIIKTDHGYNIILQEFYEILDKKFEFKFSNLTPLEKAIEKIETLEKINNELVQILSSLIQNHDTLVEYTIGLATNTPRPIPCKISSYTQDISTIFINSLANLGKNLNREDIGYNATTHEFKIINFL
ncbi:BREX system Lon protease-like protein BrxL [Fusobacterium sp.]|uniref:BREX system Lon protease-like protein BrxL n=1 Tax=Fusobacterium sp. TaxID=68766 RepID=UPI00260703FA|nr:BREX system Lon protease-like protein BrxL [Fusobacterium sp.]